MSTLKMFSRFGNGYNKYSLQDRRCTAFFTPIYLGIGCLSKRSYLILADVARVRTSYPELFN